MQTRRCCFRCSTRGDATAALPSLTVASPPAMSAREGRGEERGEGRGRTHLWWWTRKHACTAR